MRETVLVELPQDELFAHIGRFTLGFLEIVDNESLKVCGSGTLVQLGGIAGIITCAHVVERILQNKNKEVGLLCFPVRRQQPQSFKIPLQLLETLPFGAPKWTQEGPDIAFVKLPSQAVAHLRNFANVLSLEAQLDRRADPAPAGTVQGDLVAGVIDEWTSPPILLKQTTRIMHTCLLNTGHAEALPDAGVAFDRFEFTPAPTDEDAPPFSYGGSSGGGLWRIWISAANDQPSRLMERRLVGVAYFQTDLVGGARKVICHGLASIYDILIPAIHDRWKESRNGS